MNDSINKITFIDLFAGIGGVRLGFEQAGFECVFSNDCDKNCKITYDHNFSKNSHELYLEKIEKVQSSNIPSFDILTGGFPCQPFSIAGYRKGFSDKGRGNLFFEIIRILKDKQPKAFLLENVKNLKNHNNGKTLELIYSELENIGYHVADEVLNTLKYSNIPQNRERIYIVGFLNKNHYQNFNFPTEKKLTSIIKDHLLENVDDEYYYSNKAMYSNLKKAIKNKDTVYQWRRQYVRENKSKVCPTLTANMGTGGHNVPLILDNKGIRKLTPRECANFQGFPQNYKLPELANSNLYKQIGNSVTVPVIKRIAVNIKKVLI